MINPQCVPETFELFSEIWIVDTEYVAEPGVRPKPVCLVAEEFWTRRTLRLWQDQLGPNPPYGISDDALFVAYAAPAELGIHLVLNWDMPVNVLDLYAEYLRLTNGRDRPYGAGLLGASAHHGISGISRPEKDEARDLILGGGPWDAEDRERILEYCHSDVVALRKLLLAMAGGIDLDRALIRGRYMAAVARMEHTGLPVDKFGFQRLMDRRDDVRVHLIEKVDTNYDVFDGESFREDRFVRYLVKAGIAWPRHPTGRLRLDSDTFEERSDIHPELKPLRDLRRSLTALRSNTIEIGPDGRNRAPIMPFRSLTGRNQPPSSRFLFGQAAWWRSFIQPDPECGVAYLDWDQQEFGIAAALSGDQAMMEAYLSGDPYLAFAKQAGAVPEDATKQTHRAERDVFKACVLAVQYGMGPRSLGERIGRSPIEAQGLLDMHRRTYAGFWSWSDAVLETALIRGWIDTVFGWRYHLPERPNERTIRNFPMQANGAEMLRMACIIATEAGIEVCAPVHDAVLIHAPLESLDAVVAAMKDAMLKAARIVLNGFEIGVGAEVYRYPDRFMDDRGVAMWEELQRFVA
jgi:DNA polymerase-1